jgi:hypothetical protein
MAGKRSSSAQKRRIGQRRASARSRPLSAKSVEELVARYSQITFELETQNALRGDLNAAISQFKFRRATRPRPNRLDSARNSKVFAPPSDGSRQSCRRLIDKMTCSTTFGGLVRSTRLHTGRIPALTRKNSLPYPGLVLRMSRPILEDWFRRWAGPSCRKSMARHIPRNCG